jgi:hypothetical protein
MSFWQQYEATKLSQLEAEQRNRKLAQLHGARPAAKQRLPRLIAWRSGLLLFRLARVLLRYGKTYTYSASAGRLPDV